MESLFKKNFPAERRGCGGRPGTVAGDPRAPSSVPPSAAGTLPALRGGHESYHVGRERGRGIGGGFAVTQLLRGVRPLPRTRMRAVQATPSQASI